MMYSASNNLAAEAQALLFREARLLDDGHLEEWLTLFTDDALYWIPIDETQPTSKQPSLVLDDKIAREERVYHLLNSVFPAQNPKSRLLHMVSNIEVADSTEAVHVRSAQVIFEMRSGDYTQIGLGKTRPIVASVHHSLRKVGSELRICEKKMLLLDRDMPQHNLTFII